MKNTLILSGLLACSLVLAACGKDSKQPEAPPAASTAPAVPEGQSQPVTAGTAPPQAEATPAPAGTAAGYQIPPFPVSNVAVCDRYASEARRCLNEYGTDKLRHAYEHDIRTMLQKVTPKEGQPVNEWLTGDCRRDLESLALRFKQCSVQK